MKKNINLTLLIIFLSFISCNKEFKPQITKITPEIYFNLKSKIHKKTVIHFWWSFCDPCIRDYPELNEIVKKNNIDLINISSDKSDSKMQENLEKVMAKLKMKDTYIIDYKNLYPNGTKNVDILGDFAKKIKVKECTNPYYILINEKGNIIAASSELKQLKKAFKLEDKT